MTEWEASNVFGSRIHVLYHHVFIQWYKLGVLGELSHIRILAQRNLENSWLSHFTDCKAEAQEGCVSPSQPQLVETPGRGQ